MHVVANSKISLFFLQLSNIYIITQTYILHLKFLFYPFICVWTLRLFSCLGYY